MSDQRIPKVGEVWTIGDGTRTVWAVYDGQVAVETEEQDVRMIVGLDYFLGNYDPPEPTVVESRWITLYNNEFTVHLSKLFDPTHRLDLMSDGEFRVVKL